jgi:thiopeptide-type bacteriocin biosynthesis protein
MWVSFHIYTSGEHDPFLVDAMHPWLENRIKLHDIADFFFLRYFDRGPHIRLRVKPRIANPNANWHAKTIEELRELLIKSSPSRPDIPYQWQDPELDGQVILEPYHPEYERYGANEAMLYAEKLFCDSSILALKVIRSAPKRAQRYGVAVDLMKAALTAVCSDNEEILAFLTNYEQTVRDSSESLKQTAQQKSALPEGELGGWQSPPNWTQVWTLRISQYGQQLTNTMKDFSGGRRFRIIASHIHLLNNRMGLGASEERKLASRLISEMFTQSSKRAF